VPGRRRILLAGPALLAGCGAPGSPAPAPVGADPWPGRLARLLAAYPDHLAAIEGDTLAWHDGTRMPLGTALPERPFEVMLRDASIADQLRQDYAPGSMAAPPPPGHSPGRLRNTAFFLHMYGDCRGGGLPLRPVTWMPRTRPQRLMVTTVNDVAGRLERVIEGLEGLPDRLKAHLVPSGGGFACRAVADTGLPSMHAHGAAIDIATRQSDYWAWSRGRAEAPYRNRIPFEIVGAFEAERFLWGGKWHHFDTMHFEYRPELFP
jgi:hypothetical protein